MLKRGLILVILTAITAVAISGAGILSRAPEERPRSLAALEGSPPAEAPSTEDAIDFFAERVRRDPQDAVSLMLLGQLHAQRARETGDVASLERAEFALERSVELLPNYAPAGAALAAVYYSEHRFTDALEWATSAYRSSAGATDALATIGDANLALGRYRQAGRAYRALTRTSDSPAALARLAHLAWLRGRTEQALDLMDRAAVGSLQAGEVGEAAAWYQVRLGDLNFGVGRLDTAYEHYEAALELFDGYYVAVAGLGRVRAAQGRLAEAIELYERAVSIVPQPDLVAALGDLYTLTGESERAEDQYATVEVIGELAALNRQVFNRQLALFYADHDRELDTALRLTMEEIEVRKDVFGYDALAWALHKNGRDEEAVRAIERAMRLGTRDASLLYHAGMIYEALGQDARATTFLVEALALNPNFSPLQAGIPRSTLDDLRAEP
jgi:tetratricopeptide (TPR) repeat protein